MLQVFSVDRDPGSQEERLPGFTAQFPHLASSSRLDDFPQKCAPWHWHKSMELFYVKSGALAYQTPSGTRLFRAGSGGMVNSNVLHQTQVVETGQSCVQYVHLFEPELVAGVPGGTVEQKYIAPLRDAPGLELIALSPKDPAQAETLRLLQESFALDETAFGYELRLQTMLCAIWLRLIEQVRPPLPAKAAEVNSASEKIKPMMLYIHSHMAEKLPVRTLAAVAFCSERECYRVFHEVLHTTPTDYIRNVRIQMACKLLIETQQSMTEIAQNCGLGSGSYFGAQFREKIGCTPTEYRRRWQDIDI